jgi:hypothetical protein
MKSRILLIFAAFSLIWLSPVNCQTSSKTRDKFTLLTMPYNQRPLSLYKGQFQANAGYKFAIMARTYDKDGNLVILKKKGTASVYHYYFLELKYGILNFLEFSAETNYLKHGIRSPSEEYISLSNDISVNTLNTVKGFGDILLLLSLRLPIEYKWFDFGIRGGMYLPTAKYEPPKPSHTITNVSAVASNTFTVNYQYNNKNGYGVPVYLLSAAAKFTLSKFSLETDFIYREPLKEGKKVRWDEALTVSKTFDYYSKPYQFLLNRTMDINAALHFQAAGWLDIGINSNYFMSNGGWTEYWGNKYKNRDEYLFTLEPGLEIQISPALTIYEVAGFPLFGKNIDAPFYLFMTISYNLFPFLK